MTLLLNGQAMKVLFGSTSVTRSLASALRSERAQLAPANPPPITTTWGAAPCATAGACGRPAAPATASDEASSLRRLIPGTAEQNKSGGRGAQRSMAAAGLAYVAMVMLWFFSGNERMRLPVALKNAFRTAGAATQMVG